MNTTITYILVGVLGVALGAGGVLVFSDRQSSQHEMADGSMMYGGMDMQAEMDSVVQGLSGKTGDTFDKAFLSEMIIHHQGAVQMAEAALTSAGHKEIKDLAQNIIAAQNKEISDMQSWQSEWYGK